MDYNGSGIPRGNPARRSNQKAGGRDSVRRRAIDRSKKGSEKAAASARIHLTLPYRPAMLTGNQPRGNGISVESIG
jgi:hypothetical protein